MDMEFEKAISDLTQPINGQYPRPWMTDLSDPLAADVLIVGRNQRNGYTASSISHRPHLDALFNRNGEGCRRLYNELTGGRVSPTRQHLDRLRKHLQCVGVSRVLETNVICYSAPMSADLGSWNTQVARAKAWRSFSHCWTTSGRAY